MRSRAASLVVSAGAPFLRMFLDIIYFFHKLIPVKDRIAIVSRQAERPYTDLIMLKRELEKLSPGTEVIISTRKIDGGALGKLKYLGYMCTEQLGLFASSKAVVLDSYCIAASNLHHRKELKIIQIWHALGVFKSYGYTALGKEEGRDEKISKALRMHKGYDEILVSSENCIEGAAASFGYPKENVKVCPLPRTDLLTDKRWLKETARKIKGEYPVLKGEKVVLYAPTFRVSGDTGGYAEDIMRAFDTMDGFVLIVKPHPKSGQAFDQNKNVVSIPYSSLRLLAVCDAVITDYSAFLFEAALAKKPVYRYVPDEEEYERRRGFLIDIESLPFVSSHDAVRIARAIADEEADVEAAWCFAQKYVKTDGNAAENMAEHILSII